ncbi:phosphorylase family protein, partial [Acinetobacter baumannii]|uniref:phosphorylase family protein n=1 Tax=Acinetobacter baumannii TaxID=470 RepID=UPI000D47839F
MAFQRPCNARTMIPPAFLLLMMIAFAFPSHAEIPPQIAEKIRRINMRGPYVGLVVSYVEELRAVLHSGTFQPDRDRDLSELDVSGRRFRVGNIEGRRTIVVMSGRGMVNAAQTTQLLLSLLRMRAVIHYGRAGSANPNKLGIGDVAVPQQFAHTGFFYWEKFGGDERSFDRNIANLTFSEYNVGESKVANKLQSLYSQREVIYVKGNPEKGIPKFLFNVDDNLYETAKNLENVELPRCVREKSSSVCLQRQPMIKRVERGSSANIYVNNEAYRDFLHNQLQMTSIDTESAAIAMV